MYACIQKNFDLFRSHYLILLGVFVFFIIAEYCVIDNVDMPTLLITTLLYTAEIIYKATSTVSTI